MNDEQIRKLANDAARYRKTNEGWVDKKLVFEDFDVSPEDILRDGPTCGNQVVAHAVLERVKAHSNIDVKNTYDLAKALWDHLAPDMQEFFKEHVHKGTTFTDWFNYRVPLKGTRLPGGKDCAITFTDFPTMRLLVQDGGNYRINPEVEKAFFPIIETHYNDAETGEGTITFSLSHDTPRRHGKREGKA